MATATTNPKLTQAERTEISDQRMFEATVALLNERGSEKTRLSDIGIQAGYSRGLASHRFGNKDSLFAFVVRQVGEQWLEQLKSVVGPRLGIDAMERAIDQHFLFCQQAPDHVRAFYSLWFEALNTHSELSDVIRGIHQRRFQDVVNWIVNDAKAHEEAKREADVIAAHFGASIIGIVYYWLANPAKLQETKKLHDGLKRTMRFFMRVDHPPEFKGNSGSQATEV